MLYILKISFFASRWGSIDGEYGIGSPTEVAKDQPHPGVAPIVPGEEVVHHKYYQWVVFVLFLQVKGW